MPLGGPILDSLCSTELNELLKKNSYNVKYVQDP